MLDQSMIHYTRAVIDGHLLQYEYVIWYKIDSQNSNVIIPQRIKSDFSASK